MQRYVFGIDLGGTTIKCGLFSETLGLMEKWEIPTRTENGGLEIVSDIARTVLGKMNQRGIEREQVIGLGIGIPGSVLSDGEVLGAVNLHWGHKDVKGELEEKLDFPVYVGNDSNLAALGENWLGSGKNTKNMVMITIGTGVGGGIIANGQLLVGKHGACGQIGHMNAEEEEATACNCGNYGCLEQYASANGLVRMAKRKVVGCRRATILSEKTVTAKTIFEAYKQGDSLAEEILYDFFRCLGKSLAAISCIVDPELFVIGGGVSKAGEALLEGIQRSFVKYAYVECKDTPFVLAQLGNDAGMYGAAKLVSDLGYGR